MTSAEFTESLAFEQLEPDPAEITMGLTAQLLTLMANVYRDRKQQPQPYMPADFLPKQPPDEIERENKRRYDDAIAQMRQNYTAAGMRRRH